jgi:hypothetical protein
MISTGSKKRKWPSPGDLPRSFRETRIGTSEVRSQKFALRQAGWVTDFKTEWIPFLKRPVCDFSAIAGGRVSRQLACMNVF